ncbi:hypothetical protein FGKAn22_22890 [Ferrigenium kumadai]|uniref:DUF2059 domain-containing protein n=1 Tax=Ferrigenium kumadai TaxID=1682490 RepID=A0AAN1W150_9PROT|nr:DUF2059 domain-containing protein [Ferrigenium kumadai]BBJ00597.1 hypothetical protein FGKAn22_22890 [Ferrigenium kumadai]
MRFFGIGLFCVLLGLQPAMAAEAPASEASVRELIEVTQAKNMFDSLMARMDAIFQTSMNQALAGQTPTAEQKKIMVEMQSKMVSVFKEDMKWESLEPILIDIYRKSFTQNELNDMLTFYKSKAGQAMLAKMPIVMQNSMQAMQGRMAIMMPKLQQIQRDAITQLKASQKK